MGETSDTHENRAKSDIAGGQKWLKRRFHDTNETIANTNFTLSVKMHMSSKTVTERLSTVHVRSKSTDAVASSSGYDPSKYDLGLASIAKKCKTMKRARSAEFNTLFKKQNKGFFGFIPL